MESTLREYYGGRDEGGAHVRSHNQEVECFNCIKLLQFCLRKSRILEMVYKTSCLKSKDLSSKGDLELVRDLL